MIGCLPMLSNKCFMADTAPSSLFFPGLISTSGISNAGFNQCVLRKRLSLATNSASVSTKMVEVVEPIMAVSATTVLSQA